MISLPCQTQGGGVCSGLGVKFFQKLKSHLEKQMLKLQPGDLVAQNSEITLPSKNEGVQQPPQDFLPHFGYHILSLPTSKYHRQRSGFVHKRCIGDSINQKETQPSQLGSSSSKFPSLRGRGEA